MFLYFITENLRKVQEAQAIVPEIHQLSYELIEIQSLDSQAIIKAKLQEARKVTTKPYIVDDTSLYLSCIPGLPGPLIKWFLKALGAHGVYELAARLNNLEAEAKTIIGLSYNNQEYFFEGSIKGTLVPPRGQHAFGWNPIFKPQGLTTTFAEMTIPEIAAISMRGQALRKLKEFLQI
ncbi:MAG TPA: non-canonical purine NTP pyrophosphatase [Candidatus Babeliaceae bacterium]|nr:non-canonical purine NTP pyrophosphatase [Candidatus Babeliaceae bacterium]